MRIAESMRGPRVTLFLPYFLGPMCVKNKYMQAHTLDSTSTLRRYCLLRLSGLVKEYKIVERDNSQQNFYLLNK